MWAIRLAATQRPGFVWPVAMALLLVGFAALVSGLVDLTGPGDHDAAPGLLWVAMFGIGPGLYWLWVRRVELHIRGIGGWVSIGVFWLALAAAGSVAHIFASRFSIHVVDAMFESTSGFATVGMTSIPDVDGADRGVLAFRAMSNWLGGLSTLLIVLVLLQRVRRQEHVLVTDLRSQGLGQALVPTVRLGIRNIVGFYCVFTVVTLVAFFAAGLGWFDATAHALSTVSTGGFSTRTGSMWAFTSPPVEWVAIVAMFLAGFGVPALWWVGRGQLGAFWRSIEVRLYVSLISIFTIVASIADTHATGIRPTREALFAAVSFLSTTGFVAFDWQGWHPGVQTMLVMLMAAGTMSGSVGGGFGLNRIVILVRMTLRTLSRMLHPSGVRVVKIDGRTMTESTLRHAAGYLVIFAGVTLGGAYFTAFFEPQLRRSLVASLSAITTTGPILGVETAADLTRGGRGSLILVMLMGRSAVVPILLTASVLVTWVRREVGHRLLRNLTLGRFET